MKTIPSTSAQVPEAGWRYSINYGPDGEENYANVYAADGQLVGNLRTHHAIDICNAFAVCDKLASGPVCNLVPPPETYGGSPDEPWTGKMPAPSPAASPASPSGVQEDVLKFEPQLAETDWGPERSIEFIVRWFYRRNISDAAKADNISDRYLESIRASLASDATPAPTSGSEDGGRVISGNDLRDKLLLRLAKPASEPAGGDALARLLAWDDSLQGIIPSDIRTALSSSAGPAEPDGEIVMFEGVGKEVSWRKGKMPPAGSKLYAHPAPATVEMPDDATPEMVAAALKVDWSNEDEEATVHNVWHAMRAALAPATEGRKS